VVYDKFELPESITLDQILEFNKRFIQQSRAYNNPTVLCPNPDHQQPRDEEMKLEGSQKNYLLVPLKLTGDELDYEFDDQCVLQMIGKG
jgi:hypothetical protein